MKEYAYQQGYERGRAGKPLGSRPAECPESAWPDFRRGWRQGQRHFIARRLLQAIPPVFSVVAHGEDADGFFVRVTEKVAVEVDQVVILDGVYARVKAIRPDEEGARLYLHRQPVRLMDKFEPRS